MSDEYGTTIPFCSLQTAQFAVVVRAGVRHINHRYRLKPNKKKLKIYHFLGSSLTPSSSVVVIKIIVGPHSQISIGPQPIFGSIRRIQYRKFSIDYHFQTRSTECPT